MFVDLLLFSGREQVGKTACGPPMPDTQLLTGTFTAVIGDPVSIAARLRIRVGAGAGPNVDLYSMATGNAANTANFYISALTPGVTFTTASGATYESQPQVVPEPSSLVFVASGVLGMCVHRRRWRAVRG